MKKFSTLLSAALLSVGSLMAETTVVYLSDCGLEENDGTSPESAVNTLTRALSLIPADNDGVVVLCDQFTQTANFVPTQKRTGTITFTQVYDGVDYRAADHNETAWTMHKGLRLGLACDTRFENLTFNQTLADGYLLLIANFHEVTIGQGCEMNGGFSWGTVAKSFTILGGCQDNDNLADESLSPKINIESGDVYIVMYNRGTAKNFKRNQEFANSEGVLNIKGGRVHYLIAGSYATGLKGGGSVINISGGEIVHRAYLGTHGAYSVDGKRVITNISGGKFQAVRVFNIPEPQNNPDTYFEFNVHGLPVEQQYTLLHYTMIMDFDKVTADLLIPDNEFEWGTYPLADGTTMPYRYYLPEEKGGEDTHLVLFLHDAGSRGDDNRLQLCSMGGSPLYQIINSGKKVAVLAGQVPKEEKWVSGSGGLQEDSENSQWLDAAVALAQETAAEYNVKPENMYLVGSSNGAAGVWYLVNTETPIFARAVPIAGYGDVGSKFDSFVANAAKTHIWAFHGSEDTTVLPDGMKTLAPALEAASDKFKYTEYAGATHATIYSLAANTPGFNDFLFNHDSTGISAPKPAGDDTLSVTVNGSSLEVKASGEISVYNVAGIKIAGAVCDGTHTFTSLPSGLYIVSVQGKSVKALVK